MKRIDAFCHIYPGNYFKYFKDRSEMLLKLSSELPALIDVNSRIATMDKLQIDSEVVSLALPAIDDLHLTEKDSESATRMANNGIAEISEKYPERFYAIGTVSLSDPDFALEESRRCIEDLGLKGIQIMSNVKGNPIDLEIYSSFYSYLNDHKIPLWLHPTFMRSAYDWLREGSVDIMVGWDFDTTLALIRLISSGVLDRFPDLKVIVHHLGSLIPILAGRISSFIDGHEGRERKSIASMKKLYVDTAEGMWMPWVKAALEFFGEDHIVFGTDYPWGNTAGIIANLEQLPDKTKDKIYSANLKNLLDLS